MKKAGYFCYLYMAFSLCSLTAGEWNLTENGKSNASIVIGNPPNASETMAIKELNLYTGKIAGCELTGGKYQIRLSSMKDAPEAMRLRLEKAENPDTFYLKTHGRELVIAGKTPRAPGKIHRMPLVLSGRTGGIHSENPEYPDPRQDRRFPDTVVQLPASLPRIRHSWENRLGQYLSMDDPE